MTARFPHTVFRTQGGVGAIARQRRRIGPDSLLEGLLTHLYDSLRAIAGRVLIVVWVEAV